MNNDKWKILKDSKIIQILDGDSSIGTISLNKKNYPLTSKYLSGPMICDLANNLGFSMDYGNAKSRRMYFEDLLNFVICQNKVSLLLSKILSRKNMSEAIDDCIETNSVITTEPVNYQELIPYAQRKAINAINNVLGIEEKRIGFSRKNNTWYLYDKPYIFPRNNVENLKNDKVHVNYSTGFYILPFTSQAKGVMHAVKDELKDKNIDFKINKSGDIFNGTRSNDILKNIINDIKDSYILVADISGKNPNVYYELGLAHAWDKKVIIICSEESYKRDYKERLPFDVITKMVLFYGSNYDDTKKIAKEMVKRISVLLDKVPLETY